MLVTDLPRSFNRGASDREREREAEGEEGERGRDGEGRGLDRFFNFHCRAQVTPVAPDRRWGFCLSVFLLPPLNLLALAKKLRRNITFCVY